MSPSRELHACLHNVCVHITPLSPPVHPLNAVRTGAVRPVVFSSRAALTTSSVQPVPERRSGTGLKEFLKEKTGVTGAGTLGFGLVALALSKEIIIIHAEVRTHPPTPHTIQCCLGSGSCSVICY